MTTWTVQPSGGDYTTLQLALVNASTIANDIIEISGDWTSTPNTVQAIVADDNITIRTAASDQARHAGFDNGTTNYKLATTANRSLQVDSDGCIVDGLIIEQTGTGTSNECIRLTTSGDTLTVINTILRCTTNTSDQDCLYAGEMSGTINCENVIAIGAGRAGFQAQQFNGANTQTWNLISITAWNCGRFSGETDGGGIASSVVQAGATNNFNVFNGICVENTSGSSDDYDVATGSQLGTTVWNLDYCVDSDGTIATRDGGAVSGVASVTTVEGNPTSGQLGFRDITSAPFDLRLFDDATDNVAQDSHDVDTGAGLTFGDYAGSAVDIAGTARPATNVDRGAFEVPTGADSTLVAASGSYAWTGTAATLLHDSVMAAAGGSYAWTGTAATLIRSFLISAESGGYALTGTAATLLHDRVIAAASGSYALTGTAAGLLYDRIMAAAGGSYAWAGQDVTLLRSVAITAESVSYAWTGQTATLLFDALISAESASYAWAGQDVTLSHQTGAFLIADTGSYTLTGQDVGFLYDRVIVADSGGFVWSGQPVDLQYPTPGGAGDYGVVSQGDGVTLGASMTHIDGVGGPFASTPLVAENET